MCTRGSLAQVPQTQWPQGKATQWSSGLVHTTQVKSAEWLKPGRLFMIMFVAWFLLLSWCLYVMAFGVVCCTKSTNAAVFFSFQKVNKNFLTANFPAD
jgi:hypothetical protein